jgi:Domain of unknown function (DUF4157)
MIRVRSPLRRGKRAPDAAAAARSQRPLERLGLRLQRSAGNAAVGRLLGRSPAPLEREADIAAERLGPIAERARIDRAGRLDAASREALERRSGADLGDVHVHDDPVAHELAETLGAHGVTVGKDVYLGRGERSGGRAFGRLLGHELGHVAQQSARGGEAVQAKLRITGAAADTGRVISLLNSGLYLNTVSIDRNGDVTLTPLHGPPAPGHPTATEQALATQLNNIISNASTVTVSVSSGSSTLVGSYATGDIDIADVAQLGVGALIHELEEQFQRQVRGLAFGSETTGAHGAGIRAESAVRGATRGQQRAVSGSRNADGTINAVMEVPFTDPTGRVVTEVVTVRSNNVVSVTRR